jgi:hypothetical protein
MTLVLLASTLWHTNFAQPGVIPDEDPFLYSGTQGPNALFGSATAIDPTGDAMIVASRGSARVDIFEVGEAEWVSALVLTLPDITYTDYCGEPPGSVSILGNLAVVGCHRDDDVAYDAGAVFVLSKGAESSWSQGGYSDKLTDADGVENANFGIGTALLEGTLAVAATRDIDAGNGAGAVYLYAWDDDTAVFTQVQKLTPCGNVNCYFGPGVSLAGNALVAGSDKGVWSFWREEDGLYGSEQKFTTDLANKASISLSGALVIAGYASNMGIAYIYSSENGLDRD